MVLLLEHPRLRRHVQQGWKFALTGGMAACVDLGSLTVLVEYFHLSPYIAPVFATVLAVMVVFFGNKFFTFRERSTAYGSQMLKFALVYGTAISFNLGVTLLLIHAGVHYLVARSIAIGIGMVWNYSMSHRFVFRTSQTAADASSQ